jgi:class 3 adenylate cyclase
MPRSGATSSRSISRRPSAREDDPERAVRAGLAIVDAMASLNVTLSAADGTRLAVRIGLHTGPVVIADGGEVFGETANVAARVQGAADPDTVMITAAPQRLVGGLFVVEDRTWRRGVVTGRICGVGTGSLIGCNWVCIRVGRSTFRTRTPSRSPQKSWA